MRFKLFFLLCLGFSSPALSSGLFSNQLGGNGRAAGLGRAYTAVTSDVGAICWNPAGLTGLAGFELQFTHDQWIQGVQTEYISAGQTFGNWSFAGYMLYTHVGGMAHRTAVPSDEPVSVFSAHELTGGITAARKFGGLSVGMNLKRKYEKLFLYERSGFSVDLGAVYHIEPIGIDVGFSVLDIGKTNRFSQKHENLPVTLRLGLATSFQFIHTDWLIVADAVKIEGLGISFHGGAECSINKLFFLRFGGAYSYDNLNITMGLGLVWHSYRLDYGYMVLHEGLGESHRLSLAVSL